MTPQDTADVHRETSLAPQSHGWLPSLPLDSASPAALVLPLGSTAAVPSTSGTMQQQGWQRWICWKFCNHLLLMLVKKLAKAESQYTWSICNLLKTATVRES